METLDHVGILVRDLDRALETYRALFPRASVLAREGLPEEGVEAAMLRSGDGMIELLAPTRPATGVARRLDARGEGLHHVAYRVASVAAELERLAARGVRLVDDAPRAGLGGRLVAFVHPDAAHGVLTELVEPWAGADGE